MGLSASAATEETEAASVELASMLHHLGGASPTQGVSLLEWNRVFQALDADRKGSISRKGWCIKGGSTLVFDACPKKHSASITMDEWSQAFALLVADSDGRVFPDQVQCRKVQLCRCPHSGRKATWGLGVGIGKDFYEVYDMGAGISQDNLAAFWQQGARVRGALAMEVQQLLSTLGGDGMRLEKSAEQRSSLGPQAPWHFVNVGWTVRPDEHIREWLQEWVEIHLPRLEFVRVSQGYIEEIFADLFISWLTNGSFANEPKSDGDILVYGPQQILGSLAGKFGNALAVKSSCRESSCSELNDDKLELNDDKLEH